MCVCACSVPRRPLHLVGRARGPMLLLVPGAAPRLRRTQDARFPRRWRSGLLGVRSLARSPTRWPIAQYLVVSGRSATVLLFNATTWEIMYAHAHAGCGEPQFIGVVLPVCSARLEHQEEVVDSVLVSDTEADRPERAPSHAPAKSVVSSVTLRSTTSLVRADTSARPHAHACVGIGPGRDRLGRERVRGRRRLSAARGAAGDDDGGRHAHRAPAAQVQAPQQD